MLTVNIAFPVADNIMSYAVRKYVSGVPQYENMSIPSIDRIAFNENRHTPIESFIISKRIVTGIAFNEQGKYRPMVQVLLYYILVMQI